MEERTKERITCVDDRGDQLVTTSRRDHDCSCHVCHHQELEPHSVLAQLVAECCMNEIDHELAADPELCAEACLQRSEHHRLCAGHLSLAHAHAPLKHVAKLQLPALSHEAVNRRMAAPSRECTFACAAARRRF